MKRTIFVLLMLLAANTAVWATAVADMARDAWDGWSSQYSYATGLQDTSGNGTWDVVWFDNSNPTQLSTMRCWAYPDSGTPKVAWGYSWNGTHDTGWSAYVGFETMDPATGVLKVRSNGVSASCMRWTSGVNGQMTFTFTIFDAGNLPGPTWEGSKHFGIYRISDGTWMGDTTYNPINGAAYTGAGPVVVTFTDFVSVGDRYLFVFRSSGGNGMAAVSGTVAAVTAGWADITVIDGNLDMSSLLKEPINPSDNPPVPVHLAPRMVVGEGPDSQNHTVIRVLNEYGIPDVQFLAYPTSVTGGVSVNVGQFFPPEISLVASPISSTSTRQIRIFSENGLLQTAFEPLATISAPFVATVGDYLPDQTGDEIAIASLNQTSGSRSVLIYNGWGGLLGIFDNPGVLSSNDTLVMSTYHDTEINYILLYYQAAQKAVLLDVSAAETTSYTIGGLSTDSRVYESAFTEDLFVAGKNESTYSTLYKVAPATTVSSADAGTKENIFWVSPAPSHAPWADSQYVKRSYFRHLRTDMMSDGYGSTPFGSDVYDDWVNGGFKSWIYSSQADYFTNYPSNWEPTFTHRHPVGAIPSAWVNELVNSLPKYMMLSRLNNRTYYTDEGLPGFECVTYAHELPDIDHLYLWPLRSYVRALAGKFRGPGRDPDKFVAITPNHEMEIYVSQDSSIGDYNPQMITGFYNHLINLYGSIGKINSRFGTSFGTFDAPRNTGRGGWDAYNKNNPFYIAWVDYNRQVILRRIAQGFRECLLAGFPPETIKTHQIPANYVVGNPLDMTGNRITPIDWILSAGTGYGGTRYGVWYQDTYNFLQGAFSSGHSLVTMGEYHPVTSDQTQANNQASYLFNNGVTFISVQGDDNPDVVRNSYLQLQTGNPPRPGTTGGIGQIRAVLSDDPAENYNIACIGTGTKAGLLKSLDADGSWDGTVYVMPFHGHIDIVPVGSENQSFHLTTSDYSSGAITGLKAGDQIDISFRARTDSANGMFTLLVLHDGTELGRFRTHGAVGSDWGFYRFVLRNQFALDGVTILLNSGERDAPSGYTQDIAMENFSVLVHKEKVTRYEYGINTGTPHKGGVTFDVVLERSLTTNVLSGEGTISPDSGTYLQGRIVQLTATPQPGYRVKYWSGTDDDSLKTTTNQVTLAGDTVVGVAFELIADVNHDRSVDIDDLTLMSGSWLYESCCDNPAGYWKFDESDGTTAADSGSFSRDGTLLHFPADDSQWANGEVDGGLYFDGTDDYVEITGYQGVTGGASRTCAAWINTTKASGEIITWGDTSAGGKWIVRVNETGALRAEVASGYIYGTTVLTDGKWHHVAAVLDSDGTPDISEVRLYVDGQVETIAGADIPQPINTAVAQDVTIGWFKTTGTRHFQGLLNEVRVYDRALSPEAIRALAGADCNRDGIVDLQDFSYLGLSWQKSYLLTQESSASSDWSDLSNPNGVWSYRSETAAITTHLAAWIPQDLGPNQPAWAPSEQGVPGWFKSTGLGVHDIPKGAVACHSPAVLRWTSPVSGTITISGGCWLVRDLGRTINVTLRRNGVNFSTAAITRTSGCSGDSFNFADMSGGAAALTRAVNVGDVIDLRLEAASGSINDYVGVTLTIDYTW